MSAEAVGLLVEAVAQITKVILVAVVNSGKSHSGHHHHHSH